MTTRMLFLLAVLFIAGCQCTKTSVTIQYAVPQQYGHGSVSMTIVR